MSLRGWHGWRKALAGISAICGVGLAALMVAAMVAPSGVARADSGSGDRSSLKNFQHVFVIMMENTSYGSLIGNPNAPWINQAAQTYGLATNYHGVTHPSQPNYIAATSGSTNGVTSDNDTTVDVPNIVDELEAHGKSWKAYMQSYALCNGDVLASSCGNQLYERKHNPFISYQDVQSNPARVANIVDFSQLSADLASNNVPDFSWISPDQCHDMHGRGAPATDPCSFDNEQDLIATGDQFLQQTVGEIMASRAWTGNSVIFITWDESDFPFGDVSGCCDAVPGGGHVVMLTISHSNHAARTSSVPYNHYSMLATIEGGWKLGCLAFTCDTANVPPMADLVGPKK
ncbi:MAG TPA: alkaline phosphatase family protein [Ktedonobacterales bacterium]|nr:alkaline phosphatase family protein [Ktedonobacterales bacterium]